MFPSMSIGLSLLVAFAHLTSIEGTINPPNTEEAQPIFDFARGRGESWEYDARNRKFDRLD